jgi:hypothetical protein
MPLSTSLTPTTPESAPSHADQHNEVNTYVLQLLTGDLRHPNYTPWGATLGTGATQPLSNFFSTLGAAQAQYPNAGITAVTQETDRAALAQLFHDHSACNIPNGTYMIDAVGTNPLVFAGSALYGNGATLQAVGTSGNWGTGGPHAVLKFQGVLLDYLSVDGRSNASGHFIADGPLGVNGALNGIWFCSANALINKAGGYNCLAYGLTLDSSGGVADFCNFQSPIAQNNGTLDVWRIVLAGASGTFTIALKDKYGGAHTTGNITIGTTTIGGGVTYNVAGLPNPGGSNAATTVEGIIGTALHHPSAGAPLNTYGFGSTQAASAVYDSTSSSVTAGSGTTVSANLTFYLICQGQLLGPGPLNGGGNWVTSVSAPSGGGTATLTHIQTGVRGGGMLTIGADGAFATITNPRCAVNHGDGLCIQSSHNRIYAPDCEFNSPGGGAAICVEGQTGGTATLSNLIYLGDVEAALDGVVFDTNGDASQAGTSNNLVWYDPNSTGRVFKRQAGHNADSAIIESNSPPATAIPAAG